MSYDEQPDGDPHGECAAEIHRLEQSCAALRALLRECLPAISGHLRDKVMQQLGSE